MEERTGLVTMKGKALTLLGSGVKTGSKAPDFEVVDNSLSPVRFSSFRDRICVIVSVPSLDTSVCDVEARKFNQQAIELGDDVAVLVISMDLPFAQKRWCGASGVENVVTLSDYQNRSFGEQFGVLIKGLHLLARAVFVIDRDGTVRYVQLVGEIADEPDYESPLKVVKQLAGK